MENGKWRMENGKENEIFQLSIFNFQFSTFNFQP